MPGDLRGIDDAGELKGLTTYGMTAVELTGTSGELLQIATGKKASLSIPLPAASLATAPASIPLWYFDEANGLWKQEGTAAKTGSSYVGEVSHFSYWNCDLPNAIVPLTFTIMDASGNPLGDTYVQITTVPSTWGHIGGNTDATGYVSIFVTPNTQYLLEVFAYCGFYSPIYSQTFSVANTAVNLGNIIVPVLNTANLTGIVTDCNNVPVTNGYVYIQNAGEYSRLSLSNTGSFSYATLLCSGTPTISLIAEDVAASQQSTAVSYTLVPGTNAIPPIQACGISTARYFNYTINSVNYAFATPADSVLNSSNGVNSSTSVYAYQPFTGRYANLIFSHTGIGINSVQPMEYFRVTELTDSIALPTNIPVHITEYGAVGEFISGNFSCTLTGALPPNNVFNIFGSFRARRTY